MPTATTPRPGAPRQQGCLTSINETLSEADGVVVSADAGAGQPSLVEGGRPEAGARSNAGGVRKRERGEAPASCTSALEVADAAGADAKTEVAVPRRSGRVAARTDEQRVRPELSLVSVMCVWTMSLRMRRVGSQDVPAAARRDSAQSLDSLCEMPCGSPIRIASGW